MYKRQYESSAVFAKTMGRRYSIVASGGHCDISPWFSSARAIGEVENLASVRYLDSTVEEAVNVSDERICQVIDPCRREDGADAVILGCAASSTVESRYRTDARFSTSPIALALLNQGEISQWPPDATME